MAFEKLVWWDRELPPSLGALFPAASDGWLRISSVVQDRLTGDQEEDQSQFTVKEEDPWLFVVELSKGERWRIRGSPGQMSLAQLMYLFRKKSSQPNFPLHIEMKQVPPPKISPLHLRGFVNSFLVGEQLMLIFNPKRGRTLRIMTTPFYLRQWNLISSSGLETGDAFRLNSDGLFEVQVRERTTFYIGSHGNFRFRPTLKREPIIISTSQWSSQSAVTLFPQEDDLSKRTILVMTTRGDTPKHFPHRTPKAYWHDLSQLGRTLAATDINGDEIGATRCLLQLGCGMEAESSDAVRKRTIFASSSACAEFPRNHAGFYELNFPLEDEKVIGCRMVQGFFPRELDAPSTWKLEEHHFEVTETEATALQEEFELNEKNWNFLLQLPPWLLAKCDPHPKIVRPRQGVSLDRLPEIISLLNGELKNCQFMLDIKSKQTALIALPMLTTRKRHVHVLKMTLNMMKYLGLPTKRVGEGNGYLLAYINGLAQPDSISHWHLPKPLETSNYSAFARPSAVEVYCEGICSDRVLLGVVPWTSREDIIATGYQPYPVYRDIVLSGKLSIVLLDAWSGMPLNPHLKFAKSIVELEMSVQPSGTKQPQKRSRVCGGSNSVRKIREREDRVPISWYRR